MQAQTAERLGEIQMPQVVQDHGDEARVQMVASHVLDTTHVHADGQPLAGQRGIKGPVIICRGGIAQEVPGGVQKCIGDIGLAARGAAADRACGVDKGVIGGQRAHAGAGGPEILQHRAAIQVIGPPAPAQCHPARSKRWGSADPSSAGVRLTSHAIYKSCGRAHCPSPPATR